jgi:hypothetical protein
MNPLIVLFWRKLPTWCVPFVPRYQWLLILRRAVVKYVATPEQKNTTAWVRD